MIKEALEYIQNSAMRDMIDLGKNKIALRQGEQYRVEHDHGEFKGAPYEFSTLDGLIQYVKCFRSTDAPGYPFNKEHSIIVRVVNVETVKALLPVNDNRVRHHIGTAMPINGCSYEFGRYYTAEEFMIWLQTGFISDATSELLQKAVSKISVTSSISLDDDGVTQRVESKEGAHLTSKKDLPSIVRLTPRRTFHEEGLIKVDSPFLLRVKSFDGTIKVALFEADACAWQVYQIEEIRNYMTKAFTQEDRVVVLC